MVRSTESNRKLRFPFFSLAINSRLIIGAIASISKKGGDNMITLILILILIGLIVSLITIVGLILTIGWVFIIPLVVDIITIFIVVRLIKKKKGDK